MENKYKQGDKKLLTFIKFIPTGGWKRRELRTRGGGGREGGDAGAGREGSLEAEGGRVVILGQAGRAPWRQREGGL